MNPNLNLPQPPASNLQPIPRHLLITGASSGIGAALAALYAAPGMRLSLHGRSAERLGKVAALAEAQGSVVTTMRGDVADAEVMAHWIGEAERLQPLDLVIANAGISGGTAGNGANRKAVDAIFAVNLNGVLNTVHPALPAMLQRRRGQIAIMSSIAGFRGLPGSSAYCASKAAVRVYGEALRADLAAQGVKVNVICPGFVETPMTDVNKFRMPFLMDAARAARIIRKGLERNRACIAFPWIMQAMMRLIATLPQAWIDPVLLARAPRKPPFDG